jgi:hypothetical protein
VLLSDLSLPQNFQNAVFMTRALGSRYIWVDSLCIIQDSAEDWAREGSQMDEVHKFARLTLAATSLAGIAIRAWSCNLYLE